MKSITIHKLPDEVAKAIEEIASRTGLSQNKVIKRLLKKALGMNQASATYEQFDEFLGIWDEEETSVFNDVIKEFEKIDDNLWQ